jgi:hypothetical protein
MKMEDPESKVDIDAAIKKAVEDVVKTKRGRDSPSALMWMKIGQMSEHMNKINTEMGQLASSVNDLTKCFAVDSAEMKQFMKSSKEAQDNFIHRSDENKQMLMDLKESMAIRTTEDRDFKDKYVPIITASAKTLESYEKWSFLGGKVGKVLMLLISCGALFTVSRLLIVWIFHYDIFNGQPVYPLSP